MMITSSFVPGELLGDPPRSPGLCGNFDANQDLPEDLLSCGSLLVGGNPGANLKSIAHRCHPILVAFVWKLTKETIELHLGCLQGGGRSRSRGPPRREGEKDMREEERVCVCEKTLARVRACERARERACGGGASRSNPSACRAAGLCGKRPWWPQPHLKK